MGLTFNALRQANLHRLPTFKNAKGELIHDATGSDWTPAQWLQALTGELGEYANMRKKFERGDITEAEFLEAAANELADVQIYLDLLANRIKIDLGFATIHKFNKKSREVGSNILIGVEGWHVIRETRPGTMSGEILFLDGRNRGEMNAAQVEIYRTRADKAEKLADERADRNYELRCKIMEIEKMVAETRPYFEMKQELYKLRRTLSSEQRKYEALSTETETCREGIRSLEQCIKEVSKENSDLKEKLNAISKISGPKEPEIEIKLDPTGGLKTHIRRTGGCNNFGGSLY